MSENKNLLPCPFCGGEAELDYSNDNKRRPYVRCKFGSMLKPKCPCSHMYQWDFRTEKEAITAWNKRTCSCKKQEGNRFGI